MFRFCYEHSQTIAEAKERLTKWYAKVEEKYFDSFIPLEIIPRRLRRGLPHSNNPRGNLNTPRGFITGFITAAHSIRLRETTILNYVINRSTNASAESFNAKLKAFRSMVRGVRDV